MIVVKWTFVVGTYNATTGKACVYVDGDNTCLSFPPGDIRRMQQAPTLVGGVNFNSASNSVSEGFPGVLEEILV